MAGYIGRAPLSEAVQSRSISTASAAQTTFSFSYQPGFIDVYLNGVKQVEGASNDFVANDGNNVVFNAALTVGWKVELIGLKTFSLIDGRINYSATGAPTTGDDSADGYRVGSMWIDTTNDEVYRCTDDTLGAAVWVGTTLEVTDLGSLSTVTPTGTASASTFLAGDNSWKNVDTVHIKDGAITAIKIDSAVELGGPSLGTSSVIRTNANVINENITVPTATNGITAGPVTVGTPYIVNLTDSSSTWTII